ncbi:MAG: hypothetical protein IPJ13_04010 [Saprospiraceae bacterium]|nr:hypothetical protein [Saprospiraceae bacterium]
MAPFNCNIYVWTKQKEELRKEKYRMLCQVRGLQYLDIDEFGTKAYLKGFELFSHGNGKIRNLSQQKSPPLTQKSTSLIINTPSQQGNLQYHMTKQSFLSILKNLVYHNSI